MPGVENIKLPVPLSPTSLVFKTGSGVLAVECADILRFEADGKNTILHTTKGAKPRLLFHALAEIESRLQHDYRFARCSRSTILNLHHCNGWKHAQKDALALCEIAGTQQEYSVSRTYKADFVRAWTEFVEKR